MAAIAKAAMEAGVDLARIATAACDGGPWWQTLAELARGHRDHDLHWELCGPMVRFDADGLSVRARQEVVEAYLADLPYASTYLSVAEGNALAKAWRVRAKVYNQVAAPTGDSAIYVDTVTKKRFCAGKRTRGDGNCLIHGLSMIITGNNASKEEVRRARETIRTTVDHDDLRVQVDDLVRSIAQNLPQPGIGRATKRLIDADRSVVEAQRQQREAAKQSLPAPSTSEPKPTSEIVCPTPSRAPGTIAFNTVYGDGETGHHGILLFVNDNHYIVLHPIGDAEADGVDVEPAADGGANDKSASTRDSPTSGAPMSLEEFQRNEAYAVLRCQIDRQAELQKDDALIARTVAEVPVPAGRLKRYQQLYEQKQSGTLGAPLPQPKASASGEVRLSRQDVFSLLGVATLGLQEEKVYRGHDRRYYTYRGKGNVLSLEKQTYVFVVSDTDPVAEAADDELIDW